jgi:hypothetical protein
MATEVTGCMLAPRSSLVTDFEPQAWQDLMHLMVHSEFEEVSARHRAVLHNLAVRENGACKRRFQVLKTPRSCQTYALEEPEHIGRHCLQSRPNEAEHGSDEEYLTELDYVRRDRVGPQPSRRQQHLLVSRESSNSSKRGFVLTNRNACYGSRT